MCALCVCIVCNSERKKEKEGMVLIFVVALAFVAYSPLSYGCDKLSVHSSVFPPLSFRALTAAENYEAGFRSGRASYVAENDGETLYMYHTVADPVRFGIGRWVINKEIGSTSDALAFVDSWSVMPNLVHALNDPGHSGWKVYASGEWVIDPDLVVRCLSEDNTIFLDVDDFAWATSGFYVQNGDTENGPVFSHVRADEDTQTYLFKYNDRWIIGDTPNVMDGISFVVDAAPVPSRITSHWNFAYQNDWAVAPATVIAGTPERNIYACLRDHRTIAGFPAGQTFHRLRNGLTMPTIGLGTGGLAPETTQTTLIAALSLGYRMVDMAREYANEQLMGEILSSGEDRFPPRRDLFLISKVWPTHLGFTPTSLEISATLAALQTPYIDLYSIHWPE